MLLPAIPEKSQPVFATPGIRLYILEFTYVTASRVARVHNAVVDVDTRVCLMIFHSRMNNLE